MPQNEILEIKILGERPIIDFINTVDWRGRDDPKDYIKDYNDLIQWSFLRELIEEKEASEIKKIANEDPEQANEAFERY